MLPAPSAAGIASKALRYAALKVADHAPAPAGKECRKRAVAGKMTPLGSAGFDPACLPAVSVARRGKAGADAATVLPLAQGDGRHETRGARAPPPNFA